MTAYGAVHVFMLDPEPTAFILEICSKSILACSCLKYQYKHTHAIIWKSTHARTQVTDMKAPPCSKPYIPPTVTRKQEAHRAGCRGCGGAESLQAGSEGSNAAVRRVALYKCHMSHILKIPLIKFVGSAARTPVRAPHNVLDLNFAGQR